jgi:tRNA1(Val) A37 N6-methylase TrmN6
LATLYYNETKYQHLSIYGVDIDEATLETARENVIKAGSQIQRNITFFHGKSTPISVYGKYDVIFANSVLCFHPKPLNQILLHFPFSQFENTLQLLDAALEDGGLLAIVNTNYNFNETETSKKYVPVAKCKDNSFVPRVDRETTTLINIEGKDLDCVWVKIGS